MHSAPGTRPTRKRFAILALLFVSVLINYMDRANISVASTSLRTDLGLSMVEMGLIFSAFGWTYSLLQIPGGIMVDLFKTRQLYSVIIFLWSIATVAQGFAHSILTLIGCRMSIGVFEAPSYPANNKIVTRWFPEQERATAISIYTSAQFLGLAVMSPVMFALTAWVGWRGLFIITGSVGIIWAMLMYLLYRDPKDHPRVNEAELDFIKKGGGQVTDDAVVQTAGRAKPRFNWSDLLVAFRHRQLWGVYLGQYCLGALFMFFLTWFPTYLKEYRQLSIMSAGYWGAVPFLGAFCGVLLSGFASDLLLKRGFSTSVARKTPVLCGMLLMTTIIGANYTDSTPLVMLFMTIAFFGNGLASITWIFVSAIAPLRYIGLVGGVFNFIGTLSAATIPTVIGWLARDGDFESALIFISAMAFLGFCSYLLIVGKVERIVVPDV